VRGGASEIRADDTLFYTVAVYTLLLTVQEVHITVNALYADGYTWGLYYSLYLQ
jgi:hypothetical protein